MDEKKCQWCKLEIRSGVKLDENGNHADLFECKQELMRRVVQLNATIIKHRHCPVCGLEIKIDE